MRYAHPNLFYWYSIYAVVSALQGFNFLYLNPAFDPFSIPKETVGLTFLSCGIIKLIVLTLDWFGKIKDTSWLRLSMAQSVAIMLFWAGITTADFFVRGLTSLQLPIWVAGFAAFGIWLLREPFTNPATEKNGNGHELE